jgi:hypothetical protein
MRRLVTIALPAACAAGALALSSPDNLTTVEPARSGLNEPGMVEPDGVLVLGVLSPERAMVANPRTGESSERRLAGGTLCHGPVLAVGERVILSGSRGLRAVALSLPLTLSGRSRSLGRADTFTVSGSPGRLWLGRWSRPHSKAARVSLREVDADGRVVTRTTELLPRWSTIEAVVDNGFLGTDARGLTLWRHPFTRTQQTIRNGYLVAAHSTRFAWCRGDCRRLTLWTRRGERTLGLPKHLRPQPGGRAAFSPDARRLAMPVRTHRGSRVGVLDLATETWSVVADARIAGYESIAWSPSGHWLYFTGASHRLLAWQDGSRRLVRLPIRPGGTVMSIATAKTPR